MKWTSFILLLFLKVHGQLLIHTDTSGIVYLKWYHGSPVAKRENDVFRNDGHGWMKINSTPIAFQSTGSDARQTGLLSLAADSTRWNGMVKLALFMESFRNMDFCCRLGSGYVDRGANPEVTYHYTVVPVGLKVPEQTEGITVRSGSDNGIPPPVILKVNQDKKKIRFWWRTDLATMLGVNVYMVDSGSIVPLHLSPILASGEQDTTSYCQFETSINKRQEWITFHVYSVGYFFQQSKQPVILHVKIKDTDPPAPPATPHISKNAESITVSWTKFKVENDVISCRIERMAGRDSTFIPIATEDPRTDTIFTDFHPVRGWNQYRLALEDSSGNTSYSSPSSTMFTDVIPPLPPKTLRVCLDSGSYWLEWEKSSSSDTKGYYVFQSIASSDTDQYMKVTPRLLETSRYRLSVDPRVRNELRFKVRAIDSSENQSVLSAAAKFRFPDIIPPRPAFIYSVVCEEGYVRLRWFRNTESDLAGYYVERTDSLPSFTRLGSVSDRLFFTDLSITGGRTYHYRLLAHDSSGNVGLPSNTVTVKSVMPHIKTSIQKLKVRYRKDMCIISWQIEGEDIVGFVAYGRENGQDSFVPLTPLTVGTTVNLRVKDAEGQTVEIRIYGQRGLLARSEQIKVKNLNPGRRTVRK